MAERSTSRTLPVNRPNDTKPDLSLVTTSDGADVTVKVRPGNQGGGDDNNVDAKASDTRKVGTKQPEVVTGNGNGNVSPMSKDSVSIITSETGSPTHRFSRKDDKQALEFIKMAHSAKNTSEPVVKDRKDIIKLTEMVSEMAHLLAASGIGKDTTARALAYLNGPDELSPRAAIAAAKRDRHNKNQRRASHGNVNRPVKSDTVTGPRSPTTGSKASSGQDRVSLEPKAASSVAVTSTSSEITPADAVIVKETVLHDSKKKQDAGKPTASTTAGEPEDKGGKSGKPKKKFGRHNWSWRKGRRNLKGKENRPAQSGETGTTEQAQPVTDRNQDNKSSEKEPAAAIEEKTVTAPADSTPTLAPAA
ncbi:uncharacterized protein HMPREF1541_01125 [Cyphellophora europaea CBS 101466]|uniref:Uncharacterized protein n=1 Tax=Cyphellophora europaea (strain CBS 101466) TaxID=1220924 RepID=W2SDZ3_CYPE1|nr:uncharacterized protein HMPREF1541_01125 [Cyphellophora europaea CBS 101466]ETN46936.1 hypothetical protein HMPREF1541_01125 [Cyphellophora europaea CBS 101466]